MVEVGGAVRAIRERARREGSKSAGADNETKRPMKEREGQLLEGGNEMEWRLNWLGEPLVGEENGRRVAVEGESRSVGRGVKDEDVDRYFFVRAWVCLAQANFGARLPREMEGRVQVRLDRLDRLDSRLLTGQRRSEFAASRTFQDYVWV